MAASTSTIKVALDWTPNTVHSGLFLARDKGFYADVGLEVELLSPGEGYSITPAKRVEKGEADLCICPSESCIAYAESGKMKLQAIYAILQRDASAIVSSHMSRPKDLGDREGTYGSYNAKYEDDIVRTMISNDGGEGSKMKVQRSTGKLDLFTEPKAGRIAATWVFLPWECVDALEDGTMLSIFRLEDYNIPYGYSPVIARNAASQRISKKMLKEFVQATKKGYQLAMENPEAAIESVSKMCQPQRSLIFLLRSQQMINEYHSRVPKEAKDLGVMSAEKWDTWVQWLREKGSLKSSIQANDLYTNEFCV